MENRSLVGGFTAFLLSSRNPPFLPTSLPLGPLRLELVGKGSKNRRDNKIFLGRSSGNVALVHPGCGTQQDYGSFSENVYESFDTLFLSEWEHSTPPLSGMRYALSSCHLYLSSQFLLLAAQSHRPFLLGSPSPGRKTSQAGSSWEKSCPGPFLASHLTVAVQLASAIACSPCYAIRASSPKTLALRVFPDKN